jgi:hypothetical protein
LSRVKEVLSSKQVPDKRIPPGLSIGVNSKCNGSQAARSPPEFPIELAAQTIQSGLRANRKFLAASASTSVSCRKITVGLILSRRRLKEASFRSPPTPLMLREISIMIFPELGLLIL